MGDQERYPPGENGSIPEIEIIHPGHFYAAYIFDRVDTRESDITRLIEEAKNLGYPFRYWWLSHAMDLEGSADRLILCVHHPSRQPDAGMDLYQVLKEQQVAWDDLEAAMMEEYLWLGQSFREPGELIRPDGAPLFPHLSRPSPEEL